MIWHILKLVSYINWITITLMDRTVNFSENFHMRVITENGNKCCAAHVRLCWAPWKANSICQLVFFASIKVTVSYGLLSCLQSINWIFLGNPLKMNMSSIVFNPVFLLCLFLCFSAWKAIVCGLGLTGWLYVHSLASYALLEIANGLRFVLDSQHRKTWFNTPAVEAALSNA